MITLLGIVTLAGAIAAMALRNLVHCALALVVAFGGLAALYLQLGAQFVGFAQALVYIGAVAILIVFAILLTRGSEGPQRRVFSASWAVGAGVALAAYALCVWPANFKHAIEGVELPYITNSWLYHGPRLALQPVLVWWALYCADVIDWPWRRSR